MSDVSIAFILGPFSRTIKFGKASLNGFKAFGCKSKEKLKLETKIIIDWLSCLWFKQN